MFGVLNLNKPSDWTSRDVVNRVSRLAGRRVKCGHAGTLDPLATGVLVVCLGPATRLMPLIHQHHKSYRGRFLLGVRSNTDDIEGELEYLDGSRLPNREEIEAILPEFTGTIEQIPPVYSAIKVNGERAYKAARRGEDIEIPARAVTIEKLELTDLDDKSFELTLECRTGTYVRSLGRDIAKKLGTEAVMSSLERTSVGPFHVDQAVDVEHLSREDFEAAVIPPLAALPHLPRLVVDQQTLQRLIFGQKIRVTDLEIDASALHGISESAPIAVVNAEEELVGIAEVREELLRPKMMFSVN
ncbi:tRNA pseudouridine synthase B [Thalassoglobus neptunius]|uniref:tRNA pseudouridine synthase B n=1 Tax=Thalassoglobus neptunius TaxID=1938619 RepID=A0A5C5WJ19_9PLAN|nr:tRNA pseudouridine(55) synthase TruB [Thalassoglobus neptunius]TWT50011.1 tRNA pseudouridine synthase B [Thalassoglobus neptunius]